MSLAIVFHAAGPKGGQEYIIGEFESNGIKITRNNDVPHIVLAEVPDECLEIEAERIDLLKTTKKGNLRNFQRSNASEYKGYGNKTFFSQSERNLLLSNILEQVTTNEKFKQFDSGDQISEGAELIDAAKCVGIIDCVFPPHDQNTRKKLFDKAIRAWPCDTTVVNEIHAYFGSEVAMYFAFMDHFTAWLIPPGVFGLIIAVWNYLDKNLDVDNNLIVPAFSVFVIGWAILFVKYWGQTSSGYACTWGTIGKSGRDVTRFDFKGDIVVSKVTGYKERFFPWHHRVPYYLLSAFVTGLMLCVAFAVMVVSLNLQGYIRADAMGAKYLHIPAVSQFSEPGKWFDPSGGGPYPVVLPMLPVVLHALVIMGVNTLYRIIAEWLTALENHRTDHDFNNSLIVKRIFFESFDCYIALFYLAFCKFDINALRTDLFGLYTTDSFRRLATESVLPWLVNKWESRSAGVDNGASEDCNFASGKKKTESCVAVLLKQEFVLDEYEAFDDYLEMVIAFGYISLFASAFPLASALTVICVIIEVRSDLFKLCWVCRRPIPQQVQDIGTWETVLSVMVWASIVTNCFIFAFTTEQMMQVFPSFFNVMPVVSLSGDSRQHVMAAGMEQFVWAGVFCIEHVLFMLAAAVSALVPSRPEWVKDELARQNFVKLQESKQLHRLQSTPGMVASELMDRSLHEELNSQKLPANLKDKTKQSKKKESKKKR